jgi:hypothetical protein
MSNRMAVRLKNLPNLQGRDLDAIAVAATRPAVLRLDGRLLRAGHLSINLVSGVAFDAQQISASASGIWAVVAKDDVRFVAWASIGYIRLFNPQPKALLP